MTLKEKFLMKYYYYEGQVYMYSWQVVAALSMKVEKMFTDMKVENRQYFFFLRGAYPFYTLSNLFMLSYFLLMTPQ